MQQMRLARMKRAAVGDQKKQATRKRRLREARTEKKKAARARKRKGEGKGGQSQQQQQQQTRQQLGDLYLEEWDDY